VRHIPLEDDEVAYADDLLPTGIARRGRQGAAPYWFAGDCLVAPPRSNDEADARACVRVCDRFRPRRGHRRKSKADVAAVPIQPRRDQTTERLRHPGSVEVHDVVLERDGPYP
jgi:hypothetical protein